MGPNGRLDFLYDENGKLYGFIKDNANKYYYIRDFMQNILGIIDDNGKLVVKYSYDAYGNSKGYTDSSGMGLGSANPFRYKGYYYDSETGLYLVSSRYYNPEWCRWLNGDSVGYLNTQNINGLNLFAYCGNNPVMCYINSIVSFSRGNYSRNSFSPQRVVANNKRQSNTYFKTTAFQANSSLLGSKVSSHTTRTLFNIGIMGVIYSKFL